MEKMLVRIVAAVVLCLGYSLCRAQYITGSTVLETERTAHFTVGRLCDLHFEQTVDYSTKDGSALAGRDYIQTSGRLTFGRGEGEKTVSVPILDNGKVDGQRFFSLTISNSKEEPCWEEVERPVFFGPIAVINDNELHPRIDPTFAPDLVGSGDPLPLSDGRIVAGTAVLEHNGRLQSDLTATIWPMAEFAIPMYQFSNGSTLFELFDSSALSSPGPRLALLTGDNHFTLLSISGYFIGGKPGGELLYGLYNAQFGGARVSRGHIDGTRYATYPSDLLIDVRPQGGAFSRRNRLALQPDGKLLVLSDTGFERRNRDGTLDTTFSVRGVFRDGQFLNGVGFLLRRSGKIVISTGYPRFQLVQLNSDGSIDPSFAPEINGGPGVMVEQSDGSVIVANNGLITRIRSDGSVDLSFQVSAAIPVRYNGFWAAESLVLEANDDILYTGIFGLGPDVFVRLLNHARERDFRIRVALMTRPAEGFAQVTVERTGDTDSEAAIDFETIDGTARAGLDYHYRSGRLNFKRLEVSKTIDVFLLNRGDAVQPVFFDVRLSNPSPGYTNVGPSSIWLSAGPRLASTAIATHRGKVLQRISATELQRNTEYVVETSTDLKVWESFHQFRAQANTTLFSTGFDKGLSSHPITRFFRVRIR